MLKTSHTLLNKKTTSSPHLFPQLSRLARQLRARETDYDAGARADPDCVRWPPHLDPARRHQSDRAPQGQAQDQEQEEVVSGKALYNNLINPLDSFILAYLSASFNYLNLALFRHFYLKKGVVGV